jgi:hypothetical protein
VSRFPNQYDEDHQAMMRELREQQLALLGLRIGLIGFGLLSFVVFVSLIVLMLPWLRNGG